MEADTSVVETTDPQSLRKRVFERIHPAEPDPWSGNVHADRRRMMSLVF
jgi:hypothetical protein